MAVRTRRSKSITYPCVLTADFVSKLDKVMCAFGEQVSYAVKCADGVERGFDCKKLMDFRNDPTKAIKRITVRARNDNYSERSASLTFGDRVFGNIDLSIEGPENAVERLTDAFEDLLPLTKPWYWWIARPSYLGIFMLAMLVSAISFMSIPFILAAMGVGNDKVSRWLWLWASIYWLLPIVGGILDWFKDSLFPRTVFAIGQGATRHRTAEVYRVLIVSSLFLGIVGNLVAAVLIAVMRIVG